MFGKKKKRTNRFRKMIQDDINYNESPSSDFRDDVNAEKEKKSHWTDEIPFLPPGQYHHSIGIDVINALPLRWRRYAKRIDYDHETMKQFFDFEEEEPVEPTPPEKPQSMNDMLDEDQKTKLKAIALAEMEEARKKDPTEREIEKLLKDKQQESKFTV